MSKYRPLRHYLESRKADQAPMTFAEVEEVLGFPLPDSARAGPSWWSNNTGSHVGVSAWRDAGWKASRVDVGGEKVVFVREKAPVSITDDNAILLHRGDLSAAAARLLGDYIAEMNGDTRAALARAVHEAAIARRGRLIDRVVANAPRVPPGEPDSVQLIREDRDAR
jgi:hypothetical protein